MAKKGQKFRKFTNEEREEIVSKYLSGKYSYEQVAKEYQISWKTVESMVRKYKNTGTTRALPKGRPKEKSLTKEDYKERYEILKKIPGLPQGTTREKVTFINLYRNNYKLYNMCAVLEISPKTYYKYRNKEDPDYYDYLIIKEIFDDSKGTYGYRRIVEGLKIKYDVVMNGKKVLRIMKKYNLMPNYIRKSKKKNKNERIEDNVKPNLLDRNFTTDAPNKVWDTDVTYLVFKGSRAYLSTIIDLYDRKVIAYKISKRNDNKLVMDTLNEAISKRKDVSGLILHSDQGFQYTSYEYKAICESNGITISMSRKGTPIDDSPIESWHSLLKKETLYNNDITSLENYIELAREWIEFYNTTRIKGKKVNKKKGYKKNDK